MVTRNIETNMDVVNGGSVADPDEPAIGNEPLVHLKKQPLYILFKMDIIRAAQLSGLDENVIPNADHPKLEVAADLDHEDKGSSPSAVPTRSQITHPSAR